jgi:translation initiation factor 3 subunit C
VATEFDKLSRLATRQPGALPGSTPVPIAFLRAIAAVSAALSEAASNKKKLNATNARALNGMKQKIKKAQREHESAWQAYSKVCLVRRSRMGICAQFASVVGP